MSKSAVVDLKRFVSQLSIKEKLQMPLFLLQVLHSYCESWQKCERQNFVWSGLLFCCKQKANKAREN